ncbi:hypothetical protein A5700_08805 [Mycobacterium sp. E1214]|nr:hypothetical protein A5700_08805 [Mycobacterium sp. E1214]OBH31350.1 hypothetical protein A5693_16895 [Mycobacterium sp. E1319]
MLTIGKQLTDVVDTPTASTNASRIFFPLVMPGKSTIVRGRQWPLLRQRRDSARAPATPPVTARMTGDCPGNNK